LALSVVIHNLDFICVSLAPYKANPPLVVQADAALPLPLSPQSFQSVSRERRQRPEIRRGVKHVQFPKRLPFNGLEPANRFPAE